MLETMQIAIAMMMATVAVNETVQVDESRYRVLVRGEEVKVFNKALLTGQRAKGQTLERDRMRRAVLQVTGCRIADDFFQGPVLIGLIDCSEKAGGKSETGTNGE